MAQVVAFLQVSGRGRFRTSEAHGAFFLYAIQLPPPLCVVWVGRRASGRVLGGDGALIA